MTKKKRGIDKEEAFFFGIIFGIASFVPSIIQMIHWYRIDFNLTSYHPIVPLFGLVTATCAIFLFLFSGKGYVKVVAIPFFVSLIYNIVELYGVFKTYPMWGNVLFLMLICIILGLSLFFWSVMKD